MPVVIARKQRAHVEALASLQGRPVLVQPVGVGEDIKASRWVPWNESPPDRELWTRSVLLNEILFDVDAKTWRSAADTTFRITHALDELRVPFYPHLSGGKGTHTSIFLDPTSIVLPGATVARAQRAKVDVWTHVRMVVANAFLDAAEFPAGDDARWAPPIGNGVLDRLKIKWSALRNGSMVRVIGTPGSAGFRKTLVPRDFDWKAAAEWDAPKPAPLVFHGTPELWAVPRSINERIAAAIDAACGQAERAVDGSTREVQANPLKALAAVKAVPCVKHILDEPAPRGTRHYAFLNLAVTAKTLGLPHAGAQALLRQALAKCGLDETDPAWQTLNEVYAGGYRLMSPKCPSPHCTAWCNPNGCSFSGRFEFH